VRSHVLILPVHVLSLLQSSKVQRNSKDGKGGFIWFLPLAARLSVHTHAVSGLELHEIE
jgi:hypothetical protein